MKFSIKSIDILTENLCFTDYVIVTEEISNLELEIERLNNEIKTLLKENGNKEKVIIAQDNIIKEVREYLNNHIEQWNNVEEFINVVEEDEYILSLLDKENNNV